MLFKEWLAVFLCVILIMGMWCIYVVSLNKTYERRTMTTIQPLDLTVTYCESCKKCTVPEDIESLLFQDCEEEFIK